jgi:hypothetical protein
VLPLWRHPLYDERIRGWGADKQAHAALVSNAGFAFNISRHAFLVHKPHGTADWG